MKELKKLQSDMRNWSEDVKISFSNKKNSLKFTMDKSDSPEGSTMILINPKLSFTSEAKVMEDRNTLLLLPFDYGGARGTSYVEESLSCVMHYWVRYAQLMGFGELEIEIQTMAFNNSGSWSEAEKILAAVQLGFTVKKLEKDVETHRETYTLNMPLTAFKSHEEQLEQLENHFKTLVEKDASIYFNKAKHEVFSVVSLCREQLPFYAKKINWSGFEGFICFVQANNELWLRLYPSDGSSECIFESLIKMQDLERHTTHLLERIEEHRKIKNLFEIPNQALTRFLQQDFSMLTQELASEIMEKLVERGVDYLEIERGLNEVKAGRRTIDIGEVSIQEIKHYFFEVASHFVLVSRQKGNRTVRVFSSKREMADYIHEIVERELYRN